MSERDYTLEVRRRFGRHMLTSLGGLVGAGLLAAVGVGLAQALTTGVVQRVALVTVVIGALVTAVGTGFWSTWHNMRCPGCGTPMWQQASANASVFAARAAKHCRTCGGRLFGDRSGRFVIVLAIIAVALGLAGALFSASVRP